MGAYAPAKFQLPVHVLPMTGYTGGWESSNLVLNKRRKKLLYNAFFLIICVRDGNSKCAFDTEFHYAALTELAV